MGAIAPPGVRNLAARVPFSRYHSVASWLLWGSERISWRGVTITVNPGTILGYYTYLFGSYAQAEIDMLIKLSADGPLLADVGANAGLITLAVAHACPLLSVVAFEPSHEVLPLLHANLQQNPTLRDRITVVAEAVGNQVGTAAFLPSASSENPEIGQLASEPSVGYSVPITTLDAFFQGRTPPYVVKIDVEGAELQVLHGMSALWAAGHPRAMLIETHGFMFGSGAAEHNAALIALLRAGGWRIEILHPAGWAPLSGGLGAIPHVQLLAQRP